jgi:hypothetical protein
LFLEGGFRVVEILYFIMRRDMVLVDTPQALDIAKTECVVIALDNQSGLSQSGGACMILVLLIALLTGRLLGVLCLIPANLFSFLI